MHRFIIIHLDTEVSISFYEEFGTEKSIKS